MATIDYLKLRECPSCGTSLVVVEYEDGTFHTRMCIEAEGDHAKAINCYRCPDCMTAFPREVYVPPENQHSHNPFMNP